MTTRELRNVMSALLPQESERRLKAACESRTPAITTLSERPPGQVSSLILAVHVPAGSADSPRHAARSDEWIFLHLDPLWMKRRREKRCRTAEVITFKQSNRHGKTVACSPRRDIYSLHTDIKSHENEHEIQKSSNSLCKWDSAHTSAE